MEQLDLKVNLVEPVQWAHLDPWVRGACREREDARDPAESRECEVLRGT